MGVWFSGNDRVGLAHRRLAIIDLSANAAQPMVSSDGLVRIVFNGEIYNFTKLRCELENKGIKFRTRSDTEVLLELYREHGCEMLRYLRGMFAFALWDEQKRGLLLARDPLGIKPLYYEDTGTCVRVASQVKALRAGDRTDTRPEPAGHVGFFLWGHVPEPWTLHKAVRCLPAGCSLWIEQETGPAEPRRYFSIATEFATIEAHAADDRPEEAAERFCIALKDSVESHMLADVPVGVFLSSGLDSSAIAAFAAEHVDQPLRAITLGFSEFRDSANDEVPLARQTAAQFDLAHTIHWISRADFLGERAKLLGAMDQPTIDGVNTYFVSKAASDAGLKVALSGVGGDELLAGYSTFEEIPKIVHYARPFSLLGPGFRLISQSLLGRFTSPKYAGLFEYGTSHGAAYLLRRSLYMPWELPHLLDVEVVCDGLRDLAMLPMLDATIRGIASSRLRVAALELEWYMRNQLLRDTDWASMVHSLEVRVPFVDVPVLREAARLAILRRAPRKPDVLARSNRALPKALLIRKKTGFAVPVGDWLQSNESHKQRGLRGWAQTVYREFANT